jgi:PAT family beta-lactamase induction signal transducer AmpG
MKALALDKSARLRYVTFFYLYILQGVPAGFSLTAIANFLVGRHVNPEKIGTFIALAGLPWILQFVWGPLIDRFQYSSMGNRKLWIVSAQWASVLITTALFSISDPANNLSRLGLIFFANSIAASIQVASVDAMAITITPVNERGKMNGFMRGGFLLGTAFSSTVFSIMLHNYSFKTVAIAHTLILAFFSVLFFFTKINRSNTLLPSFLSSVNTKMTDEKNPPFKMVFRKIYNGIASLQSLQYLGLIAVVYFCSSVFIRSYTYHLINVLKWPDKTVSLLQGGWGSVITFIAILIAGNLSDKLGAKYLQIKVMWAICIFLLTLSLTYNFWNFQAYSGLALVLWNLADPLLSVAVFPILMGLCIKKVEGSQFTTYLAIINLCDVFGSYVTGWSLNVVGAPVLEFFCGLCLLLLLIILKVNKNYSFIPG